MNRSPELRMLYLNQRDVVRACMDIDPVAVVTTTLMRHAGGATVLPDEAYLSWTNQLGDQARSLNMPGWLGGATPAVGTKIINGNPSNPVRGIPRASGLTLLFDPTTARITCLMDAAHISSLRTACISAIAADRLAAGPVEGLGIVGAGALAEAHLRLLPERLPHLRRVQLFDLEPTRSIALRDRYAPALMDKGVCLQVVESAEHAVRGAQLVVPVTTTTVGYIAFDWLQPGAVLVNVSLDDPLPEVVLRAGKIYVDDWNLVKTDSRRLLGRMYRQGLIDGPRVDASSPNGQVRHVDAELGQLLIGASSGRSNAGEVILVNPFGMAIEDVGLAAEVYVAAQRLGLGMYLDA